MHQDVLEATVNHARLKQRAEHYASGVGDADREALSAWQSSPLLDSGMPESPSSLPIPYWHCAGALARFLDSPLATRILLLDNVLQQGLFNDAYKYNSYTVQDAVNTWSPT